MLWSGAVLLVTLVLAVRLLRGLLHPVLVGAGLCRYHSPLLYTTGIGRSREIHLGTTRDFASHAAAGRRVLLARLAEGLLALCDEVDQGRLHPEVRLSGTTDLLREKTARRLGFAPSAPGLVETALTLSAWVQVSLLRSRLRGWPCAVRMARLRRLQVAAGELAARRPELQRLRDRLALRGLAA